MAVSIKKKFRQILCLLHFNNWRQHSNFNFTSIISVQIKCTLILHKLSLSFFIFLASSSPLVNRTHFPQLMNILKSKTQSTLGSFLTFFSTCEGTTSLGLKEAGMFSTPTRPNDPAIESSLIVSQLVAKIGFFLSFYCLCGN